MAARNYFHRLYDLSDYISGRIRAESRGTKEYDRWFECERVLAVVIKYALNRGNRESSRQKVQEYWKSGCNFDLALEKLDTNYNVLKGAIARDSRLLYEELGSSILDFLNDGKPVDAHIEFVVRTKSLILSDVIPTDIVPLLPNPAFGLNINIEDCVQELKILRAISYLAIRDLINKADKDKMAHLLAIMKGDADYSSLELQKRLWGYIIGKEELKQMLNDLKVKNLIQ